MSEDFVVMPRELTAENGAKKLLIGEFHEQAEYDCSECHGDGCEECDGAGSWTQEISVKWDTIKAIYAKAVEGLQQEPRVPVLVNRALPLLPLLGRVKHTFAMLEGPLNFAYSGQREEVNALLMDIQQAIDLIQEFDSEPASHLPRWTEADARNAYRCLRAHNNTIPDEAIDAVRDWMLANSVERKGR